MSLQNYMDFKNSSRFQELQHIYDEKVKQWKLESNKLWKAVDEYWAQNPKRVEEIETRLTERHRFLEDHFIHAQKVPHFLVEVFFKEDEIAEKRYVESMKAKQDEENALRPDNLQLQERLSSRSSGTSNFETNIRTLTSTPAINKRRTEFNFAAAPCVSPVPIAEDTAAMLGMSHEDDDEIVVPLLNDVITTTDTINNPVPTTFEQINITFDNVANRRSSLPTSSVPPQMNGTFDQVDVGIGHDNKLGGTFNASVHHNDPPAVGVNASFDAKGCGANATFDKQQVAAANTTFDQKRFSVASPSRNATFDRQQHNLSDSVIETAKLNVTKDAPSSSTKNRVLASDKCDNRPRRSSMGVLPQQQKGNINSPRISGGDHQRIRSNTVTKLNPKETTTAQAKSTEAEIQSSRKTRTPSKSNRRLTPDKRVSSAVRPVIVSRRTSTQSAVKPVEVKSRFPGPAALLPSKNSILPTRQLLPPKGGAALRPVTSKTVPSSNVSASTGVAQPSRSASKTNKLASASCTTTKPSVTGTENVAPTAATSRLSNSTTPRSSAASRGFIRPRQVLEDTTISRLNVPAAVAVTSKKCSGLRPPTVKRLVRDLPLKPISEVVTSIAAKENRPSKLAPKRHVPVRGGNFL